MSENKAISCKEDTANESEDETEGADEVSEDCEDEDEDHASTIQADVEDDSESLDPRIQVSKFFIFLQILRFNIAWFMTFEQRDLFSYKY